MNRLDAAVVHLIKALKELGVRQPVTGFQISLRIYIELLRQAMRYLTSGSLAQNGR